MSILCVANRIIDDATEDSGCHNTERQLGDDLGPEVRRRLIHIIVDFAKEYRPLIREDKDDILDGVEGDVHGDEEERTLHVLHALLRLIRIVEEKNGEDGRETRGR